MGASKQKIEKRDVSFARQTKTKIWQEIPSEDNPYLAGQCRCHGYDILELASKRSFFDVLYLLFQGELPSPAQAEMLETLFIALINPGPRHPASRAAMNAGVGKTQSAHILPIGLTVMAGKHLGAEEVVDAMTFLRKQQPKSPDLLVAELMHGQRPEEGDWHIAPGFGSRFGGIDPLPQEIAALLGGLQGAGPALAWGSELAAALAPHGMGWLATGLAAAVFCDFGFQPRAGAGLFQLLSAPGILAHGLELANKPITAMPFLDEEHYVIQEND